ncbi:ubiquinone/menaquinone biosynthesis C-methylase UbiE [Evansella vedderi]|uniref:Ubiquinone/menaquinone biosynthesis C-methylase UbiE n=1 Tax=Evansella vedderi TaxID=38282 RepID=A0ABT9ZP69_9BACI|nr:class I SAM-dependent methyltransferase [Evansella vedderi]MDQ0253036.1 ubiquinone/menaquinone biosynthesis C-methylase UbiE [Evansella vedderi]
MEKIFASVYDTFMGPIERKYITKWRRELLTQAKGKVLEIGAGTGINFPLYERCDEVIALEPNPFMIEKGKARVKKASVPVKIVEGMAEKLPFAEEEFDTIVVTLVLCSVGDPKKALAEMKRVLKANGTILLIEHVKMNQPLLRVIQNMLTPVWKHLCDGCHLNRNTEKTIIESGLTIIHKKTYFSGLAITLICQHMKSNKKKWDRL